MQGTCTGALIGMRQAVRQAPQHACRPCPSSATRRRVYRAVGPTFCASRAVSYIRVREQARIVVEARTAGAGKFELLPVETGFGLTRLPDPSDGDVFLDLEGDPFVGEHGLEYRRQ
jgi:hypothetical protein